MRRNWLFAPTLFLILCVVGLVTYAFSTLGIAPGGASVVTTPLALSGVPPLAGTPVVRFARVNPAIVDVLDYSASNYGSFVLDIPGEGIQSVGAYLPMTGNTQFEFIAPTALPTPLPYPTSPPLPLPALAGMPDVPALAPDGTSRTLPYTGDGCAPGGNPVEGVLTQRFHAYHSGIDVGVPLGTPVLATHSGTVSYADWSEVGYGYLVIIQNQAFITYYAHNMSFNVTAGQLVGKGSIVAWSGSTGNSTGPHVHYETRVNDIPVDPLTFEARGYASC